MRGQKAEQAGRRPGAEKTSAQVEADEDHGENSERAPSFLTARELLAQDPDKGEKKPGDKALPRGAQKRTHKLLSDDDEGVSGTG